MKSLSSLAVLIFTIITVNAYAYDHQKDHILDESKTPRYIYVLNANSGTMKDGKLTLNDTPVVIYFSDRPYRIVGHTTLEDFIKMWNEGPDDYQTNPPNAYLSILSEGISSKSVMEISHPVLDGDSVTFTTKELFDKVPGKFSQAVLYVDTDWAD